MAEVKHAGGRPQSERSAQAQAEFTKHLKRTGERLSGKELARKYDLAESTIYRAPWFKAPNGVAK